MPIFFKLSITINTIFVVIEGKLVLPGRLIQGQRGPSLSFGKLHELPHMNYNKHHLSVKCLRITTTICKED